MKWALGARPSTEEQAQDICKLEFESQTYDLSLNYTKALSSDATSLNYLIDIRNERLMPTGHISLQRHSGHSQTYASLGTGQTEKQAMAREPAARGGFIDEYKPRDLTKWLEMGFDLI